MFRDGFFNSLFAQLVERETVNLEAVGSIPTRRVEIIYKRVMLGESDEEQYMEFPNTTFAFTLELRIQ